MPSIPNYTATKNIKANQAAPFRNEAEQPFKDQQKIIGTLTDSAQQWSNANDVMQYTEAKAKYETQTADIRSRAAADENFKNSEKYYKELEDAKKNSLAGIKNQQVGNKLGQEFEYDNKLTAIKMGADFNRKQLEYNKVQVATNLDALQQKKLTAVTSAESKQYEYQINELLNAQVNSGVLSAVDAGEMRYNSAKRSIEGIIYANPQAGLMAIKNDTVLNAKDKMKLTSEAQQMERKNKDLQEWQLQQVQTQNTIALSEALQNNTLTPLMVREMQQNGMIDSETASVFTAVALKREYEIPTGTSLIEPDYFLSLLEDSGGDKVQINKILKDAATAYNEHKIGINQYQYFIQNSKEIFDRQSKGIFTKNPIQQKIQGAIHSMRDFFFGVGNDKEENDKNLGEGITKFFDRFKQNEDPDEIKNTIQREFIIEKNPGVLNLSEEGQTVMDDYGNIRVMNNKLEVQEIKKQSSSQNSSK